MRQYIFIACSIFLMACGTGTHSEGNVHSEGLTKRYDIDLMKMGNAFYEVLIDSFCCTYYDKKLPGYYIHNSLRVTGVSSKDIHTVEVRGTHSFKGRDFYVYQEQYDNRWFVATVNYHGANEYLINFCRRLEWPASLRPGEWKYTGELPLIFQFSLHKR